MQVRVWSEFLSCQEASDATVLSLLERNNVGINFSVKDDMVGPELADFLRATAERNIRTSLWLLLPRSEGYWPSERNAERFAAYVDETLEWGDKEGVAIKEIAVDLEPPLYFHDDTKDLKGLRAAWASLKIVNSNLNRHRFRRATMVFRDMQEHLTALGIKTYVPVIPMVVDDIARGREVIQDMTEGPVSDVPWDYISPMIYTTMLQQFSNKLITRRDAVWLVYAYCKDLVAAVGPRASVSIGTTGTGILETEWTYTDVAELREDAAAAKAAGVDDIAIFNLEGILQRDDPDAWLRAVIDCEPQKPDFGRRGRYLRRLVQTATPLLGLLR